MRGPVITMLVTLSLATTSLAGESEIPVEYTAAVQQANAIGTQLFVHDVSASRATDELFRRKVSESDSRLRGWITEQYGDGSVMGIFVTFVGDLDGKPFALHRVRVPAGNGELRYEAFAPAVPLNVKQTALWQARSAAIKALDKQEGLCGERYNPVVLPPGTAGIKNIRVYMLAATTQPDLMIAGGHLLFEYDADGKKLLSQRAFTRSCIDIPTAGDPEKGELKAITLTHLMDPTPTEIHVFLSRNYDKTIMLGTTQNSLMWIIPGKIVAARSLDK